MDTIKADKRKQAKENLTLLPAPLKAQFSIQICKHLLTHIQSLKQPPDTLLGFLPLGNEPDLRPFFKEAAESYPAMILGFPRVEGDTLSFHSPAKLDCTFTANARGDWIRGSYGLLEPAPTLPVLGKNLPWGDNLLVLAPGLAFDQKRGRLGRGKGYYDRFLLSMYQKQEILHTIGVCFSVQIFEEVPMYKTDASVDLILTEKGFL